MQLFKFFHTEITSKEQKMVPFVRNYCLVKIILRLFQSISVVINMVPMLLRQFKRLSQGVMVELYQLTKTAYFIAPPIKRHIQQFITCLLVILAMFPVFFPDKMKMSNLLHIGLILIISNVFTILSAYFASVRIGNTVVTFKTKQ